MWDCAWTICAEESEMYDTCIAACVAARQVSGEWRSQIRKWADQNCKREELKGVIHAALRCLEGDSTLKAAISTVLEFAAACKYASTEKDAGNLTLLRGAHPAAVRLLLEFCTASLQSEAWKHRRSWFDLRAKCMDAHAVSTLSRQMPLIQCHYAGMFHTKTARAALLSRGFEVDPVPCALCHEICKLATSAQVLQVDVLRVASSNRRVLLLGENHSLTDVAFAEKMIKRLKAACDKEERLLLLLERHIYGSADVRQQNLSCDQRGTAIHVFRCAPFLQKKPCRTSILCGPILDMSI